MKLLVIATALFSLSFCSAYDFICPRDIYGDCIEDRFAYPECDKYYRCFTDGENCPAFVFDCPPGLHFSPPVQECVEPYIANCIDSTTVSTTTYSTPVTGTSWTSTTPGTPSTPWTPTPGPEGIAAFSAARSYSWYGGAESVYFDKVDVNLGDCFKSGTTFLPGRDGVYFASFSGGISSRTPADISIHENNIRNPQCSIYRTSTTPENPGMMYRNFLIEMDMYDSLTYHTLNSQTSTSLNLATSFSGFSLTDMFNYVEAFYVARDYPFYGQEAIPMTEVYLNVGNNYDIYNHQFVAPQAGVYYFFFGSGQATFENNRIALMSWEGTAPETEAELWVHSTSHNGLDMANRGMMMELYAGQRVWLNLQEDPLYSDAEHNQAYFGGFLYEPKQGPTVAWAVHRDKPWQGAIGLDPVPFEVIGVNEGNAFQALANRVIIPTRGYYYMEVSFGTLPYLPLNVDILVNGQPEDPEDIGVAIGHAFVASTNHSHVASTGRSLIVHLEMHDVVRLKAQPETGIFSDLDKQTSWMGFLLYAD